MISTDSPRLSRRAFLAGASAAIGMSGISGCGTSGEGSIGCSCSGTAAVEVSGAGRASGPAGASDMQGVSASASYPLRRPPKPVRHLQTANGSPFFLLGDTAWSIAVSASQSDVIRYLDNRRANHFNALTFNVIEHEFAGGHGNRAPCNWYGERPFRDLADFTTPCEAYWRNVDFIIRQAAARDMLCVMFPAYEGYLAGNQGWYGEMASQGPEKLRRYGAWLAERYLAYDNILWVAGGDNDPASKALTRAVIDGIRSRTTKWLVGWHGARDESALSFWAGDLDWLDLNTIYDSASRAAASAAAAYSNRVVKPFARIEDTYENPVGGVSPAFIRWLAWDSGLQGGTGAIYGDVAVWRFNGPGLVRRDRTSWVAAMERPAAASMKYLRALFESVPWTRLVPDYPTRVWMTEGWSRSCLAALADDRSFGVAYVPYASKGLTLDLGKMTGPAVSIRWYDPTSGAFFAEGRYEAHGQRSFARASENAGKQSDWALLLESVA